MLGRSHLLLTGARYLALVLHPLATLLSLVSVAVPQLPQDVGVLPGPAALAAAASLAPDLDRTSSPAAHSLGVAAELVARIAEHTLHHRRPAPRPSPKGEPGCRPDAG